MKTQLVIRSNGNISITLGLLLLLSLLTITPANANTQLVLTRDAQPEGEFKGLVDLTAVPGFEAARVTITVDGEKIAEALPSPYRVTVDLGPIAVQHKIVVTAVGADKKKIRWQQTINQGHLPLTVKVNALDAANRQFEARVTAPADDPVIAVDVWDNGQKIASVAQPPYRFTIPPEHFAQQFVQVTAKAKSGEEAADFWTPTGEVHVESVDVRTVPLYISVVDRSGATRTDVERDLFTVMDNGKKGEILEFGKAFDQPISIALLLDASASMTYSMQNAEKAATSFVQHTLKDGDRCTVFSVRDVPRREVALTADRAAIEKAIGSIKAGGRTSLYDAIGSAIREMKDEKNRRAIVVLTDGADTTSVTSFDEIDRLTKESGIPVYFIAYDSGEPTEVQDVNRLTYLASETGGFLVTASERDLTAKYGDIERDLRAQYAILYKVVDYAKHGAWRKVRVVMNSPKLTARTINGYFAP
ncbi:MAG TPA: VWA domain-containing protein [Thermoanaerobaculia bacterium]|nr:VWA domain-containing protein [Thermoanaerobaculia bacterium]